MSKFTQTLCIIFAFVSLFSNATGSRPHPALQYASAPENQPSCDSFELNMNDCSPYLEKDSKMAEPGTSCCSGVMDVWKVDSKCAGEVLKSVVNLRNMNETRVTHVSSTCGFMDISLDKYLGKFPISFSTNWNFELDYCLITLKLFLYAEASLLEARFSADKAKAVGKAVFLVISVMLLILAIVILIFVGCLLSNLNQVS